MNEPLIARIEAYLKLGPSDHIEPLGGARTLLREALAALKEYERRKTPFTESIADLHDANAKWIRDNDPNRH